MITLSARAHRKMRQVWQLSRLHAGTGLSHMSKERMQHCSHACTVKLGTASAEEDVNDSVTIMFVACSYQICCHVL